MVCPIFHYITANILPAFCSFLKALFFPNFYVTAHNKFLRNGLRVHVTHVKPHGFLQSFLSTPLDGSTNLYPVTCWGANGLFFFVCLRQMKGSVSAQSNSINRRMKPGPPHGSMNEK